MPTEAHAARRQLSSITLSVKSPGDTARLFLAQKYPLLQYSQKEFTSYGSPTTGARFRVGEDRLLGDIWRFLEANIGEDGQPFYPTTPRVKAVLGALKCICCSA